MTIKEVCSCGAEIELYSKSIADSKKIIEAANEWRLNHQHKENEEDKDLFEMMIDNYKKGGQVNES